MFVPGWMWQTMHWLDGMARVNTCLMGWPDSFFGIVGSTVALSARCCRTARTSRSARASGRWRRSRGRRCSRWRGSRRDDRWCRETTAPDRAGASSASRGTPGSVRNCVPKPRSLEFHVRAGRVLRRAAGLPSLRLLPCRRARRRAAHCRAAKFPSAAAVRGRAGRPSSRVSSAVGGGSVFMRCGLPSRRVAFAEMRILQGNAPLL